jgi:small subunit ribosomal protein S17
VIAITPSWRESQHVRHVVKHIIAPYGVGIDERPPVPPLEERVAEKTAKRESKDERRALRRQIEDAALAAERLSQHARKAIARASAWKTVDQPSP